MANFSEDESRPDQGSELQKSAASSAQTKSSDTNRKTGSSKRRSSHSSYRTEVLRSPLGAARIDSTRELDIFDVIGILKRQVFIIVISTIVGVSLAGYYYTIQPKRYQAESSIYIPEFNSMSLLNGVNRSSYSTMENLRGDSLQTHAMIIKSVQILSAVWNVILNDPEKRKLMKTIDLGNELLTEPAAIGVLQRIISIKVGGAGRAYRDTNTITIMCESLSPDEAAMIVNTLVEQYRIYFVDKYNSNNNDVRQAIEDSQRSIEAEIEAKRVDLFEFIKNSPTTFIGSEENNPLLTSLTRMSEKMVEIDLQILRLENQLQSLENQVAGREIKDISDAELIALMGGGDGESILSTITSIARGGNDWERVATSNEITFGKSTTAGRIQTLRMQLLELQGRYSDGHPKVKAIKDQIAELEAQTEEIEESIEKNAQIGTISYQELFETYTQALKRRAAELCEEKEKINTYVDSKNDEIRRITEYRETIESKKVSIESLKSMQERLEQNLKQLALVSGVNTYQVEVISAAEVKPFAVYPVLPKFLAIGLIAGLAFGVTLAYLIDITDATFHKPSEVTRALRMPILTHMASFKRRLKLVSNKKINALKAEHKPQPSLLTYYQPNDPICEVFRQLRTRLFNQRPDSGCVVVMNTSPHPSDGKTTISANLAVKVAEAGKRVLLIDCDLRKQNIYEIFGMDKRLGVVDFLQGACTLDESIVSLDYIPNLDVMTGGLANKKNAAQMIASNKFDEMMIELRKRYDVILIDTPPVLYVNDAATIVPRTDGVLYTFRIRRRGRPEVLSGARILAEVNANFLGCIVNCHDKHRFYNEFAADNESNEYGYGGYGASYGYGSYGQRHYGGNYGNYGNYGAYGAYGAYGNYGYGVGSRGAGGYGNYGGYGASYGYGSGYGGGYGAGYGGGYGEGGNDQNEPGDSEQGVRPKLDSNDSSGKK